MATPKKYAIEITAQTEGVKTGLKEAKNAVNKQMGDMTKTQETQSQKIDRIKKDLLKNEKKYIKEATDYHDKQLDEQLKNVKGNARAEYEVKKKWLNKMVKLQQQATQEQKKAGAPKPGTGALGVAVGDATGALTGMAGGLGATVGKMGPYGAAAAAALGATTALANGLKIASEKSAEYNGALERLATSSQLTSDETAKLSAALLDIQRPASISAVEIVNIASGVSAFAENAEDIPRVTQYIADLAAAYPDVDPSQITQGMQRLTNQLGDSALAMDVLASGAKLLKGSVDPLGEAATEISTIFTKASGAIRDTDKAIESSLQLFNAFTKSGYEISEATSTAEIVFEDLAIKMKDTAFIERFEGALQGTNTALSDIGLEVDNIDISKLVKFLSDGSEESRKLAVELGTPAEHLLNLSSAMEKSGRTMADFVVQTQGAGTAVSEMVSENQAATNALSQAWENLLINLGSGTSGALTDATSALAELVGGVAKFFEPAEQSFARAVGKMDEFGAMMQDIQGLLDSPSENTAIQLKNIESQIDAITEISPMAAKDIENILANAALTTEEKLREINNILGATLDLASEIQEANAFEALSASSDAFGEAMYKNVTMMEHISDIALEWAGKASPLGWVTGQVAGTNAIAKSFEELSSNSLPNARKQLESIETRLNGVVQGSSEWNQIYNNELIPAKVHMNELETRHEGMMEATRTLVERVAQAQVAFNDGTAKGLESQQIFTQALMEAEKQMGKIGEHTAIYEELERAAKNQLDVEIGKTLSIEEQIGYYQQQLDEAQLLASVEGGLFEMNRMGAKIQAQLLTNKLELLKASQAQSKAETKIVEEVEEIVDLTRIESDLGIELLTNTESQAKRENEIAEAKVAKLELVKSALEAQIAEIKSIIAGEQAAVDLAILRKKHESDLIKIYQEQHKAQTTGEGQQVSVTEEGGTESLEQMQKYLDDLERSYRSVDQAIKKTTDNMHGAAKATQTAQKSFDKMAKDLKSLTDSRLDIEFETSLIGMDEYEASIERVQHEWKRAIEALPEEYRENIDYMTEINAKFESQISQIHAREAHKRSQSAQEAARAAQEKILEERKKQEEQYAQYIEKINQETFSKNQRLREEAQKQELARIDALAKHREKMLQMESEIQTFIAEGYENIYERRLDGLQKERSELRKNFRIQMQQAALLGERGEARIQELKQLYNLQLTEIYRVENQKKANQLLGEFTEQLTDAQKNALGINQFAEKELSIRRLINGVLQEQIGQDILAFQSESADLIARRENIENNLNQIRVKSLQMVEEMRANEMRANEILEERERLLSEEGRTEGTKRRIEALREEYDSLNRNNRTLGQQASLIQHLIKYYEMEEKLKTLSAKSDREREEFAQKYFDSINIGSGEVRRQFREQAQGADSYMERIEILANVTKSYTDRVLQSNGALHGWGNQINDLGKELLILDESILRLKSSIVSVSDVTGEFITGVNVSERISQIQTYLEDFQEIATIDTSIADSMKGFNQQLSQDAEKGIEYLLESMDGIESYYDDMTQVVEKTFDPENTQKLLSRLSEIETTLLQDIEQRQSELTQASIRGDTTAAAMYEEDIATLQKTLQATKVVALEYQSMLDNSEQILGNIARNEEESWNIIVDALSAGNINIEKFIALKKRALQPESAVRGMVDEFTPQIENMKTHITELQGILSRLSPGTAEWQAVNEQLTQATANATRLKNVYDQYLEAAHETDVITLQEEQKKIRDEELAILHKTEAQWDAIGAHIASMGDFDLSQGFMPIIDGFRNLRDAMSDTDVTFEEKIENVSRIAAGLVNTVGAIPDAIKMIGDAFKKGKADEGAQQVGTIMTQIGQALLSSGIPPLMIAGAVILVVGMLTKLIAKIATMTQKEKSAKQIAEERADQQERILKVYEAQVEALEQQIALNNKAVTSSYEQLEAQRKLHEGLIESNEEREKVAGLSDEQLASQLASAKAQKEQNEYLQEQIEKMGDMRRSAAKERAEQLGLRYRDMYFRRSMRERTEELQAQAIELDTQIKLLEDEIGYREDALKLTKLITQETESILDWMIELSTYANDYNAALEQSYQLTEFIGNSLRDMLELEMAITRQREKQTGLGLSTAVGQQLTRADTMGALDAVGGMPGLVTEDVDIQSMTDDELYEYIMGFTPSQLLRLDKETQAILQKFVKNYQELTEKILGEHEALIDLRFEVGDITEEEAIQEKRLAYQAALDKMLSQNFRDEADILKLRLKMKKLDEEEKKLLEEQNNELARQIALRANAYDKARELAEEDLAMLRNRVSEALDIELDTDVDLFNYIQNIGSQTLKELDSETRELISNWLELWENFSDSALADEEKLIRLREEAAEITEEEMNERLLELYSAELQRLIDINATEEEILEMKIKILEAEEAINGELESQMQNQSKLGDLVRERQKQIEAVRRGEISEDSIEIANERIRQELIAQGMTENEIEQFMRQLPQRERGGMISEGLYYGHDDEYVMNADAVQKYGVGFMESLNNLDVPMPQSPEMGMLTGRIMERENTQNITINVQVANEWDITGGGSEIYNEMSIQQREMLYDAINTGIQSRKINLLTGGRL